MDLAARPGIEPGSHGLTVRPHTYVRFVHLTRVARYVGLTDWGRSGDYEAGPAYLGMKSDPSAREHF